MKAALLAFFAIAFVPSAHAASFDCAKARAPEEIAVCADRQLSALDGLIGTAFAQAKEFTKDDARRRRGATREIHSRPPSTCESIPGRLC